MSSWLFWCVLHSFRRIQHEEWWWWIHRVVFSLSRAGIDLCLHGKTLIQQTELIWMGCYESWKETTCTHRAWKSPKLWVCSKFVQFYLKAFKRLSDLVKTCLILSDLVETRLVLFRKGGSLIVLKWDFFGGVSVHCDSWVSSNFSIEVLLPEENISQLRLMYQALLDPTGGLTGPHVVLGEKKRNTVHTLARLSSSQEPRRRSRLLMISTSATHGKWIMLNAAGWNSPCHQDLWVEYTRSSYALLLLLTRHNSHTHYKT